MPEIVSFIAAAKAAVRPASPAEAAVLLEGTLELFGKPNNWDQIADFYLEALEDVPIDLVARSLKHLRQTHQSHWRFPNPADLVAPIRGELAQRKLALMRARAALAMSGRRHGVPAARPIGQPDPEPVRYSDLSATERAAFDAKMDAHFAALGGRSKPRGDVVTGDRGGPMRPLREILAEATALMASAE
jgi:hypothetical protein